MCSVLYRKSRGVARRVNCVCDGLCDTSVACVGCHRDVTASQE